MHTTLILLAAGSGTRMGGSVEDKILACLAGVPVFARSVRACTAVAIVRDAVVVFRDAAQQRALQQLWLDYAPAAMPVLWVQGGVERADSVRAALAALPSSTELVLIHDAARPLVDAEAVAAVATAAATHGAAVLAHRVTDTIKRVPDSRPQQAQALEDLQRARLWAMETPQAFWRRWIEPAYSADAKPVTDDTAALTAAGHAVFLVENLKPNPKITLPTDLDWAEFLLARSAFPHK